MNFVRTADGRHFVNLTDIVEFFVDHVPAGLIPSPVGPVKTLGEWGIRFRVRDQPHANAYVLLNGVSLSQHLDDSVAKAIADDPQRFQQCLMSALEEKMNDVLAYNVRLDGQWIAERAVNFWHEKNENA